MKGRVDGLLVGFFPHALALHSDVHPIIGPEEREGGVSAALAAPFCSLRVCLVKARIRRLHVRLKTAPGDLCLRVYPEDHDDEHAPRLAAGGDSVTVGPAGALARRWSAGALEPFLGVLVCRFAEELRCSQSSAGKVAGYPTVSATRVARNRASATRSIYPLQAVRAWFGRVANLRAPRSH
jgi:hypothetical protein